MKKNFKYCFIFVFAMLILGTTNVYAVSNLTITEKSYVLFFVFADIFNLRVSKRKFSLQTIN